MKLPWMAVKSMGDERSDVSWVQTEGGDGESGLPLLLEKIFSHHAKMCGKNYLIEGLVVT